MGVKGSSVVIAGTCVGILIFSKQGVNKTENNVVSANHILVISRPFSTEIDVNIANAKRITIISNWLPQWIEIKPLEEALNKGATVQMIFLRPESRYLEQRSLDLGNDTKYGQDRLKTDLKRLRNELCRKVSTDAVRQRLSIRFHDSLPSALIIRCDEQYYFALYLHGRSVSDTFIFKLPKEDSPVVEELSNEINYLISKSQPLDILAK